MGTAKKLAVLASLLVPSFASAQDNTITFPIDTTASSFTGTFYPAALSAISLAKTCAVNPPEQVGSELPYSPLNNTRISIDPNPNAPAGLKGIFSRYLYDISLGLSGGDSNSCQALPLTEARKQIPDYVKNILFNYCAQFSTANQATAKIQLASLSLTCAQLINGSLPDEKLWKVNSGTADSPVTGGTQQLGLKTLRFQGTAGSSIAAFHALAWPSISLAKTCHDYGYPGHITSGISFTKNSSPAAGEGATDYDIVYNLHDVDPSCGAISFQDYINSLPEWSTLVLLHYCVTAPEPFDKPFKLGGAVTSCQEIFSESTPIPTLSGRVTEINSGNGVSGITIHYQSGSDDLQTVTDADGRYQFELAIPLLWINPMAATVTPIVPPATHIAPGSRSFNISTFHTAGVDFIVGDEAELAAIPQNLLASDGTSGDYVRVNWDAANNADTYLLYRSKTNGTQGDLVAEITATQYDDASAVPGVQYFYSVVSKNIFGESQSSNFDGGYRADVNNASTDCDGDGVNDAQELLDGTRVCDGGSFQLHLKSPAYTKYNTFLSQSNFLEVLNSGSIAQNVTITAYDASGKQIASGVRSIAPNIQVDVDINALLNFKTDQYGLIRIDFDSQSSGASLMGRLVHYRTDPNKNTYSFVFARELRNATHGNTFAVGNSFDAQGNGNIVPNWLEILNLENETRSFGYKIYNQNGEILTGGSVGIGAMGEFDVQSGHEFGEGVYLVEVWPKDGASNYLASVSRYSSNSRSGGEAATYNYAFSLETRMGTADALYVPSQNKTNLGSGETNWIEVVNTLSTPVTATVEFRDEAGTIISTVHRNYAPKSQFHFNASALLAKGHVGSVKVTADKPEALIVQSLAYIHDCGKNALQTAFAIQGSVAGRDRQLGTYNSFLGVTNNVQLISASASPITVATSTTDFTGASAGQSNIALGASAAGDVLATSIAAGIQADEYGTMSFQTQNPASFVATLTGTRILSGNSCNTADFVVVRQVR